MYKQNKQKKYLIDLANEAGITCDEYFRTNCGELEVRCRIDGCLVFYSEFDLKMIIDPSGDWANEMI